MNIDEINGFMDLAVEELSTAQILFDTGMYRGDHWLNRTPRCV